MMSFLLILQAATTAASGGTFDVRDAAAKKGFGPNIVVTGRRRDELEPFQAKKPPNVPEEELLFPKAEIGLIGKAKVGVTVGQEGLAQGATSNRAMVGIKLPF